MSKRPLIPRRGVAAGVLVAFALVAIGCGDGRPERVPVSGIVKIDGVPMTMGSVTFIPADGRSAMGQIDANGRFTLSSYKPGDGALLGPHTVEVKAREMVSETTARWHAPKKYANHQTSGIQINIDKPTSDLEINLTWDGGKPFIESDT